MRFTLRHRLVMLMAAAMVPLFGLSLLNAWLNQKAAVSQATDELNFAASLIAANQSRVTESAHQLLLAIANTKGLLNGDAADCPRYLRSLTRQFPVYANLGFVGLDGYVSCVSEKQNTAVFVGDRDYFRQTLARHSFTLTGYKVGRIKGKAIITFALPVMSSQGDVSAVVFAAVDLNEIAKAVAAIPVPKGSRVTLMDRDATVLATNPPQPMLLGKPVRLVLLQQAVKSMSTGVGEALDRQGQRRLYSFLPAGLASDAAFFVALSADRNEVLAPTLQQLKLQLAALALMALMGAALAWRVSGSAIVAPALALVAATGQLRLGRLDVRIPIGSPDAVDEFSRIGAGFNLMAESLQQQRQALEAELAHSRSVQEKLHDAQRVGCIGYWQIDLVSRQMWCSHEVYELLGVDSVASECAFDGFFERLHPADRDAFKLGWDAAIEAALPLESEFRILTPAGEVRWMVLFGRVHADVQEVPVMRRSGVIQDITRRKLAEQALIDSEQRYAALFESAPVPMWLHDMDGAQFLTVNQRALEHYGYGAEEFGAMTLFDITPETQHPCLRQQLAAGLPAFRNVWQHRRKDGSVLSADVVSHLVQYGGRVVCFAVALDISAQLKAEGAVQDHLFTLQRAADAAQAITWHQTLEGTMQEVAEQARGVIGAHQAVVSLRLGGAQGQRLQAVSLSEKYAFNQHFEALPDRAGMETLVCESGHAMHLTQAELQAHPRWRGAGLQATARPALRGWLAVPLAGRDGKNIGLLQLSDKYEGDFTQQDEYVVLEMAHLASAAMDNTRLLEEVGRLNAGLEQKVAERTAELARQEALFRALAEQAPQTVWTASPEGAATYYNRAWFALIGGELKDWSGYQWLSIIHPDDVDGIKARWKTARASLQPYSGTRRFLARDGCFHTMTYRASPVFDAQGRLAFWVGIDADITEIKAIEAALRLSNQELEAFSYSVSHDLRSPLNTVDGFSRLLAKQLGDAANDKVRHYLARIQAGVAQMGQLIEDLLLLSQTTRAQLRSEPLDLTDAATRSLAEWHSRQPERQVRVSVQPDLRAVGDGRLLEVALENLLANAWKFTSQQENAEISVGQQMDAAGQPIFFVRDNGAGFDMAYADKLFLPFQRLHAASEFPGTGIGLAIVSRVIERHGGHLWAESAPGCGATFFFTLPRLPLSV